MPGQQDLHASLRVVIAATRALLDPDAGLSGRARELAESAGRNAERLARLIDEPSARGAPTRGLVDVASALGISAGDGNGDSLWAIVDPEALRAGVQRLAEAARSADAVSVRAGTHGGVEVVVSLPGLASAFPARVTAGWKPVRV